jgi:beta-galactosidase
MLANWRKWLERKYGTVAALNRAWGTTHGSFAEITTYPSAVPNSKSPWSRAKVDFAKPGVRGAHYDWCAFNNERVTGYFRSLATQIKSLAPDIAIHVKVMMGLYFTGSTESRGWGMPMTYHTFGIDQEAIVEFADLLGCDLSLTDLGNDEKPNRFHGSAPYVIDWLNAGLSADFLKSLAPDKPFYNSELHAVEPVDATEITASAREHIETALWLASLHGMSGNLLWFWGRENDGKVKGQARTWFKGSLLQQPWVLQGYAQTSLELRRYVAPVMAFSRQPRPVRLLYSEPSAIQDVHYMDCLRDSYEALNFLGLPIGFLTERQLAAGIPGDAKLIIVPNAQYVADTTVSALDAARANGVVVKIVGPESLSRQPTGGLRTEATDRSKRTIPLGTPQKYHPAFDRWLKEAGIFRELLALDASGKPAWGVEVRTARSGDQRLAYLVNENREPTTVRLQWSVHDAKLTDWRTGKQLGQTITLRPRQVVFGAY